MLNSLAEYLRGFSFIKKNKLLNKIFKKLSFLVSKVLYGEKKKVKIANQYDFYLDSIFAFSNYENWGEAHNDGFGKLIELSKNKEVVFDIGGHVGLCSLPMSQQISDKGMIYTFEPSNLNRKYLEKHLKYNNISNVNIVNKLLGEKEKENIAFYELSDVSGTPSIVNIKDDFVRVDKSQTTLDKFCEENSLIPDLIKIDVEGAEFFVLEGAVNLLKKHHPDIIISLHPKHLEKLGRDVIEIFDICEMLGYKLYYCNSNEIVKRQKLPLSEFLMKKES